jgi:hypothetical protein
MRGIIYSPYKSDRVVTMEVSYRSREGLMAQQQAMRSVVLRTGEIVGER